MSQEPKNWTYDTDAEAVVKVGQYIASIGKRGVNSVWLILKARRVQHKYPRDSQGWALQVVPAPDVKELAVYDEELNQLWVRGELAHPFFWYPRNAK
jgi:hypothetical protein